MRVFRFGQIYFHSEPPKILLCVVEFTHWNDKKKQFFSANSYHTKLPAENCTDFLLLQRKMKYHESKPEKLLGKDRLAGDRQRDSESCSFTLCTLNGESTVVLLNKFFANNKTETCTLFLLCAKG